MTTADGLDQADDELSGWLAQAFAAERAPARCRLPVPKVVEAARPVRRSAPAARGSFVLMLALSAVALLLQP
jgi:hypothetical protein